MDRITVTAGAVLLSVLGSVPVSGHAAPLPHRPSLQAVADRQGPRSEAEADSEREERWSAARIARDIVGQSVQIRDVAERLPWTPWTFEADEPREVQVLDRQVNGSRAVVTIDLATHDNMDTGEETTYVSGKLRLHYERQERGWQLRSIENISFRASAGGIST